MLMFPFSEYVVSENVVVAWFQVPGKAKRLHDGQGLASYHVWTSQRFNCWNNEIWPINVLRPEVSVSSVEDCCFAIGLASSSYTARFKFFKQLHHHHLSANGK
jgi:hypothetical protein